MHGKTGRGRGKCRRGMGLGRDRMNQRPLSECCEETVHIILDNADKQSMEMGLFTGAKVHIIRNKPESPNMVVGVNESRYMISKDTARKIMVG